MLQITLVLKRKLVKHKDRGLPTNRTKDHSDVSK